MEPITREEILIAAAATGKTPSLTPITREEMFLAKAAGMDVNVPEPITRKEMFLSMITGSGNSGEVVDDLEIVPDFSAGDYKVVSPTGLLVRSAIIKKPKTLVPDNIAEGVEIAGVVGTHVGGGEVEKPFDCHSVTFVYGDKSYVRSVADGDTCADPVERGLIPTPTKESTVQYNYTYYGWGASDGGAANANILKNITEDKTVYAIFTATVRYYTITYLDSDGVTVLKTEQLPYGTVPSYVPTSSSGIFQEWIPAPTAVAGNASYKAVWSAAIVVIPQITLTVKTDGTEGIGPLGSATEGFVWGAKYRLTVEGETSEWVATKYYTTFADGNKFTTSGIGNPWARALREGSAVTAHRQNSHTGPMVSDTGENFFVSISGPTSTGQYTATLYAKKAGTYTFSVVRVPD